MPAPGARSAGAGRCVMAVSGVVWQLACLIIGKPRENQDGLQAASRDSCGPVTSSFSATKPGAVLPGVWRVFTTSATGRRPVSRLQRSWWTLLRRPRWGLLQRTWWTLLRRTWWTLLQRTWRYWSRLCARLPLDDGTSRGRPRLQGPPSRQCHEVSRGPLIFQRDYWKTLNA